MGVQERGGLAEGSIGKLSLSVDLGHEERDLALETSPMEDGTPLYVDGIEPGITNKESRRLMRSSPVHVEQSVTVDSGIEENGHPEERGSGENRSLPEV